MKLADHNFDMSPRLAKLCNYSHALESSGQAGITSARSLLQYRYDKIAHETLTGTAEVARENRAYSRTGELQAKDHEQIMVRSVVRSGPQAATAKDGTTICSQNPCRKVGLILDYPDESGLTIANSCLLMRTHPR